METSFCVSFSSKFSIFSVFFNQPNVAFTSLHSLLPPFLSISRFEKLQVGDESYVSHDKRERERERLTFKRPGHDERNSKFGGREWSRSMEWHAMAASEILFFCHEESHEARGGGGI